MAARRSPDDSEGTRRKYYFDGGHVEIAAHLVYELDPDGNQLRVVKFTDYAAEKVRTLYPSAADLRKQWADPAQRAEIIARLEERGIDFDQLRARATSRKPILSTCFAISPSTRRCGRGVSGPSGSRKREEFLREIRTRSARDPERSPGKICRARHRAVRHPRCSESPADFGPRQCDRDRPPVRRAGKTARSSGRITSSPLRGIVKNPGIFSAIKILTVSVRILVTRIS